MEPIRQFLTAHNFDPAQAEMTMVVVVVSTLALIYILTRSPKAGIVTTVLTKDRRSVEKYSGPASRESIMQALTCAIHAPNHWRTEPWRFRLLGAAGKLKLADLNDKFKFEGQFGSVPDFLVVSIKAGVHSKSPKDFSEWNVNALEDHAACACAVQNFMVSCASQGVATKWMTGKMGIAGSDILTECCGVNDTSIEHYMGTILIGKPQVPMSSMKVPERKTGINAPVFEVTA